MCSATDSYDIALAMGNVEAAKSAFQRSKLLTKLDRAAPKPPTIRRARCPSKGLVPLCEASKVTNVSRMVAPRPPELEVWKGRSLQAL